ncbi:MAG: polyribonucleotide nucleotidyltransferase [Alphaproteobacteria bacterium GM7ARS4]|nr:polyribonucleotide nucleotidyltransferase [Alphaproteobacteria bacterium GM7ARS4]
MFSINKKELTWGGVPLSFETGRIARQADGSVLAFLGESCVLATVVADTEPKLDIDFVPLSVNYMEKGYAAGRIPGGFFKREGRPSERETLISRLIDRPIRPLFPSHYRYETQVICTVMSFDQKHDTDVLSINAASCALTLAGLLAKERIVAASKVGYIDKKFVLNPSLEHMENSSLELVVAGTKDGVLMVESEASQLSEQLMLDAVMFGHEQMIPVIDMISTMAASSGAPQCEAVPPTPEMEALRLEIESYETAMLAQAYQTKDKQERRDSVAAYRQSVITMLQEKHPDMASETRWLSSVKSLLKEKERHVVREQILKKGERIDGRQRNDVRPIVCETGIFPRTHGSSLFTRGETQAIAVTTLGSGTDEQIIDGMTGGTRESFMMHYNFPPYSVGETGRVGFTGRREVGHGKLAWRALHPVMPSKEDFPYTLRIVSEITESNGSSSMATVCASSLSLMDAGVPLAHPVAGIAMGLIKEGDDFVVLSDILGDEDHLGDMDFKVAGTEQGITSLQMDIKVTSIHRDIMQQALAQAREGRLHILTIMNDVLSHARKELSVHAPQIQTMQIATDKIRDVIGSGGKVIREICQVSEAKVDINDEGVITIAAVGADSMRKAKDMIESIVADPEVGRIYRGKVVKCLDFGAFVNFMTGRDGLVHISELVPRRVEKVTDIVREGDEVNVKVLEIDNRGKIRLTMKDIQQ